MLKTDENGTATVWLPPASIGARRDVEAVRVTIGPDPDGGTAIHVYENGKRTIKYIAWRIRPHGELLVSFVFSQMRPETHPDSMRRFRWMGLVHQLQQG